MKALIFCGGFGTRMNNGKPGKLKPLIKVAGKEILMHVISIYENAGLTDFILLGGYKVEELKKFAKKIKHLNVTVLDTGEATPTGGRLLKAKKLLKAEPFLLTYGDSLTNYSVSKSMALKEKTSSDFVVSTYQRKLEYGILKIEDRTQLKAIYEKTFAVAINAGFYFLDQRIFSYIHSTKESFEIDVLPRVLAEGRLSVGTYQVDFWHPMDTPVDRKKLEDILRKNPKIIFN